MVQENNNLGGTSDLSASAGPTHIKAEAIWSKNGPRTVVLNSSCSLGSSDETFFKKDTMLRSHCRLIFQDGL